MAQNNQTHDIMSIFFKILIGLALFFVAVVLVVFFSYLIIVIRNDRRWRNDIDENYNERNKAPRKEA